MMITYLTVFIASFTVAFSGAMMPGPLLTTCVTESLRRGFVAAPLLMAGHGLLEMALLMALLFGLSPLFQEPWFFVSLSFLGGLILLGMAWATWRSAPVLELRETEQAEGNRRNLILKGVTVSLANPYFTVWWATIGLGYIMHSRAYGPAAIAAFFTGHILADCLWYGAVSFALSKGRAFLNLRLYRGAMAAGAVFLAFFALYFLYAGFVKLPFSFP